MRRKRAGKDFKKRKKFMGEQNKKKFWLKRKR